MIPSTTMQDIIEAYRDQRIDNLQLKEMGYIFDFERMRGDKQCTEN